MPKMYSYDIFSHWDFTPLELLRCNIQGTIYTIAKSLPRSKDVFWSKFCLDPYLAFLDMFSHVCLWTPRVFVAWLLLLKTSKLHETTPEKLLNPAERSSNAPFVPAWCRGTTAPWTAGLSQGTVNRVRSGETQNGKKWQFSSGFTYIDSIYISPRLY